MFCGAFGQTKTRARRDRQDARRAGKYRQTPAQQLEPRTAGAPRALPALTLLGLALTFVPAAGCEPPKPPCVAPPQAAYSVTTTEETAEPVLWLSRLDEGGRFPAAEMVAELTLDEPLLVVETAKADCSYTGCLTLTPEEIATAGPGTTLRGYGRPTVVARYSAGQPIRIDLLAHGGLYLIRPDALRATTPRKITVVTRMTPAACVPNGDKVKPGWGTRAFDIAAPFACGDGILHAGEVCDDGNSGTHDGCEADKDTQRCRISPSACEPGKAGEWHAFRCEGKPSRCEQLACRFGAENPPECGTPAVYGETGKGGVDAYVRLVVDGRTKTPTRVQIKTGHGDDICGCTEDGLRYDCDPSCLVPMPCAVLAPQPPPDGLTFQGVDHYRRTGLELYNLTQGTLATGHYATGQSGAIGPTFSVSNHEEIMAHAAAPDGTEWIASLRAPIPSADRTHFKAVLYRVSGGIAATLPMLSVGGWGAYTTALAADPDGKAVWSISWVHGDPLWDGQPISGLTNSSSSDAPYLSHISQTGALLGVSRLDSPYDRSYLVQSLLTPSRPGAWFQLGLLTVGGAAASLTTYAQGKELWKRQIGSIKSSFQERMDDARFMEGLGRDIWVYFRATTPFESPDFKGTKGDVGGQIWIIDSTGALASKVSAEVLSWSRSPDGQAIWSVEGEQGKKPWYLRKRNSAGAVVIEQPLAVDEKSPYVIDVLALPNDEVILARPDAGGVVVLSRWEVSKSGLRRKWVERTPLEGLAHGGRSLGWDEPLKAIRVLSQRTANGGTYRAFFKP
ncbi:MAG: hypothetical protein R3F14_41005 [Polyangiaceae bacterium]